MARYVFTSSTISRMKFRKLNVLHRVYSNPLYLSARHMPLLQTLPQMARCCTVFTVTHCICIFQPDTSECFWVLLTWPQMANPPPSSHFLQHTVGSTGAILSPGTILQAPTTAQAGWGGESTSIFSLYSGRTCNVQTLFFIYLQIKRIMFLLYVVSKSNKINMAPQISLNMGK